MNNLYELSKTFDTIGQEIIDAEGLLSVDLEKRLDEVNLLFKDKAGNIARWIKNIESNEPGIENEIDRLQKRLKTHNNLKERLKQYLKFCMENAELHKIEISNLTISIDKNPPSVEINDENELPAKYVKIVQTTSIDRKSILNDLKAGKFVSGACLNTEKTHLKIR